MKGIKGICVNLNTVIACLFKAGGNVLAKILKPSSRLYQAIVIFGMRLSSKARLKRRTSMYLETVIVDHCNLKCVGCSSFGCIARESYVSVPVFKKNMERLSELSGRRIEMLSILGGEPLLHPLIVDFMRIARKCFPIDVNDAPNAINIITNGILLPSMSEEFYRVCGEENISISITKYPISIDMTTIQEKCNAHYVKLGYWNGDVIKNMWKRPFDLEGKQDADKSFRLCISANRCATFKNGKIFPCPTCAHIEHFNNKFGTALEVTERDYVDVYKAKSIDDVYDFLCHSVPFCRYCKSEDMSFGIKWHKTKGEISEWI